MLVNSCIERLDKESSKYCPEWILRVEEACRTVTMKTAVKESKRINTAMECDFFLQQKKTDHFGQGQRNYLLKASIWEGRRLQTEEWW